MMSRRRFSSDFKAKVALDALRGDKTIQEISSRYKVHAKIGQLTVERDFLAKGLKR